MTFQGFMRVLLLIAAYAGATVSFAQDNQAWLSLLRQQAYPLLEQKTVDFQEQFSLGKETEFALRQAYRPFYSITRDDLLLLDEWEAKYPKSYAVKLVRGTYFKRAFGSYSNSGQSDSPVALELYGRARAELRASLALTEKPFLSVFHLLDIAQNDPVTAKALMERGSQILPSNTLIRSRYLRSLGPNNGGSLKAMNKFVIAAGKDGATKSGVLALQAVIYDEMGKSFLDDGKEKLAIENFSRALDTSLKLGPDAAQEVAHAWYYKCRLPGLTSYCH